MSSVIKPEDNQTQTNGTKNEEVLVVIPSSSSSEEPMEEEEEEKPKRVPDSEPEPEEEEEVKSSNNSNQQMNEDTVMEEQKETKKKDKKHASIGTGVGGSGCSFPTARVNRIMRSEGSDLRVTQEALFLINKATEQFLELFCEDVYATVTQERKKAVHYKHLSSTVSNGKRYDFLSDFVPEKIKAEDALVERSLAEE